MTESRTLSLLLIDDDELDRAAVMRALRQSEINIDIVQACSAVEGLQLASARHFDAILLDYQLPDQDGLHVLKTLRGAGFESMAVLMLSRREDEALAERCLAAGAQDFLLKDDVNGRRLVRAVRQARQRYAIEEKLKASRNRLLELSERDPLTKLSNRRGFENALGQAIARVERGKGNIAVLLLDLDQFKEVNDSLGHEAGDDLLVEVALRLSHTVRNTDVLCRLGGDEFVVLMTDLAREDQAALLATRIVEKFQQPVRLSGGEHRVTASIGIATMNKGDKHGADLLRFADMAMYKAKQDGRNTSRFYSSSMQQSVQARSSIKRDLLLALQRKELELFYEPRISAEDGAVLGAQVHLRWQHPTLGLLEPESFDVVAQETGLTSAIDDFVCDSVCKQLRRWQSQYPRRCEHLQLSVTLSSAQLLDETLSDTLHGLLDEHGANYSSLELSIPESDITDNFDSLLCNVSSLAASGVSFSLTELGRGSSSLEYISRFPLSALVISTPNAHERGDGQTPRRMLSAIAAFAGQMGMRSIVQHVDTPVQAGHCIDQGFDVLQGKYYSGPLPVQDFESRFLQD